MKEIQNLTSNISSNVANLEPLIMELSTSQGSDPALSDDFLAKKN